MSFCGTAWIPSACARFGRENTPNERVESRARRGPPDLKDLAALADNQSREARRWFEEAIKTPPRLDLGKTLLSQ